MKEISFLWLNVIDVYNNYMNLVDIADQLRNQYCSDHWIHNKKWWWEFFIWAIRVAAVNGWKIYKEMHAKAKEKEKEKDNVPSKWSHCD